MTYYNVDVFFKKMTLRKITIDNSVRYIPKSEQTKEIKQNKIKNKKQSEHIRHISGGGKTNKNISHNSKKVLKNVAASGFGILK